jgi:lipoprotein-anchoring transpeptidase ErfK/SrfK
MARLVSARGNAGAQAGAAPTHGAVAKRHRHEGGPDNPIGARAMYLWQGNKDTLYRIHGTNEPWTIGTNVSSGCIRLTNEDVVDLYNRTPIGAKVVVLGTAKPAAASQ